MSFGSRLKHRQTKYTMSVITQGATGTQTTTLSGLSATRQQRESTEFVSGVGMVVNVTYQFEFYQADGELPTITENQILYDGTDKYEILQVLELDYLKRLPVTAVKLR